MKTVHLIDACAYFFRAFYAVPDNLQDDAGRSLNGVHGYARFLAQLLTNDDIEYAAVAFDESLQTSFRNEIYPDYKANREPADENIRFQLDACKRLSKALGFACHASSRYEADDLLANAAAVMRPHGFCMTVVTSDKDLSQILREPDTWWDYARRQRLDYTGTTARLGIAPERIPDLIALAGDAVDNIPGIPGIGVKTARALLNHFESLDELYAGIDTVSELPLRGARRIQSLLTRHQEQAELSRQLAVAATDAGMPDHPEKYRRQAADKEQTRILMEELRIDPALRRQLFSSSEI
jgi:5'-3' exonuclease